MQSPPFIEGQLNDFCLNLKVVMNNNIQKPVLVSEVYSDNLYHFEIEISLIKYG
jgi:hypothetical protein